MAEIQPIGLPNLLSQGDLLARARAAQSGSERVSSDQIAEELQRAADRRAEQVQKVARVEQAAKRRREREQRSAQHDPHERFDQATDDDDDDPHLLDVTA